MSPNVDPLPVKQWLAHQGGTIRQLLDRASLIDQLNRALREWNDSPWLANIRLANIRGTTLVFYSSSAAALVNLRHHQSAILDFIQSRFQISCTAIDAKVRPADFNLSGV